MASTGTVLAIFAHPDDLEFRAAGTMLRLREKGFALHMLNLSSGNCGSVSMNASDTARVRAGEAQASAQVLGAAWHPSIAHDLEILYDTTLLRQVAATVREVNPTIVLTHALQDYMEDHMITARLSVTATFAKGIPNFGTEPPHDAVPGDVTLYHAMPHGLTDPLRNPVKPDLIVDTASVHAQKRQALAEHRSQKEWLDQSQGMDSYLAAMDDESRRIARLTANRFAHGEGWCRHLHLGMSARDTDPLAEVLGDACVHL